MNTCEETSLAFGKVCKIRLTDDELERDPTQKGSLRKINATVEAEPSTEE